jgi:2-succinyl-6-hydroxy-2,4-cyclohexadiene-1-carboxylate synthase
MNYLFPGFLGTAQDLAFLPGQVVMPQDSITPGENDLLLGYSMGGRRALELAQSVDFKIKHLILLASHPGLVTIEEKSQRKIWEDHVLERMRGNDFLDYWNALDIFKSDTPLSQEIDLEQARKHFEHFRLSKQPDYLPLMQKHADKITYIVGSLDERYVKLAQERLVPAGIHVVKIEAGHRLFQHPEKILTVLKDKNLI